MTPNPSTLRELAAALREIAAGVNHLAATLAPAPNEPGPPPVPVTLPTDPFDEAYYLEANPDVAAAVRAGVFTTGHQHYLMHGKAEGRLPTRPSSPATPPPAPPPSSSSTWEPAAAYASPAALVAAFNAHADFATAITIDGKQYVSGFGPALAYHTWGDGTVRQAEPATPPATEPQRHSGEPLLSSYANLEALLADAAAVGWQFAILVDGTPVKKGFEADPPAEYRSQHGRLVKA
jgi:hypothetical protein